MNPGKDGRHPRAWIVLGWALLVFPAVHLRAFHYEEGLTAVLARGALEDGHWLVPHAFGLRLALRPVLLSWLAAGLGRVTGTVDQWTVRAVPVLSLLAGGLLVFGFTRRRATVGAGLFATACLFCSPMILQKVVVAEPDLLLSLLLFAAFALWWNGHEAGRVSLLRWMAVTLLLVGAGLAKGPQPLAYFGLGVGLFLAWRRRARELAQLALAGAAAGAGILAWYGAVYEPGDLTVWAIHGRLAQAVSVPRQVVAGARFLGLYALETLPGLLVVVPFAASLRTRAEHPHRELALALLFYAWTCTAVLPFWPGANGRYAMPSIFPLAVTGGLAFEWTRAARPRWRAAAAVAAVALGSYQIVLGWVVMPRFPELFGRSREAGRLVARLVAGRPAPLFAETGAGDRNLLAYVPSPIRGVHEDDLLRIAPPAWVVLAPPTLERLRTARPDLEVTADVPLPGSSPPNQLVRLERR